MNKEIETRLRKIIEKSEEGAILNGKFNLDADLVSLGINSLMFIKLIVAIEVEFDIEIDDDDLDIEKLNTFGELINYIELQCNKTSN